MAPDGKRDKYSMKQEERLDFLVERFKADSDPYQDVEIPKDFKDGIDFLIIFVLVYF